MSRSHVFTIVVLLTVVSTGCSLRKLAVNQFGDAIAAGGSTFSSDDDPELVGDALPFSLKLMESLLAESPEHTALLVAAARGFTQYSWGWIEPSGGEVDAIERKERSTRLYLRARDYGLRALATSVDNFSARLVADPVAAVAQTKKRDVPALYWTAAAWGLAISASRDDPEMLADLPIVDALISRAATLDPDYDNGAIDTFLITWEASRSGVSREAAARAQAHFARAVDLTNGDLASPYVAAAEALAMPDQDRARFIELLQSALKIDPGNRPDWRLQNILARRRAEWLLAHADDYFYGEGE